MTLSHRKKGNWCANEFLVVYCISSHYTNVHTNYIQRMGHIGHMEHTVHVTHTKHIRHIRHIRYMTHI